MKLSANNRGKNPTNRLFNVITHGLNYITYYLNINGIVAHWFTKVPNDAKKHTITLHFALSLSKIKILTYILMMIKEEKWVMLSIDQNVFLCQIWVILKFKYFFVLFWFCFLVVVVCFFCTIVYTNSTNIKLSQGRSRKRTPYNNGT